jgi:hypothetical protein
MPFLFLLLSAFLLLGHSGDGSGKPARSRKKAGLPAASANTGSVVSVQVRMPVACMKRPVPPVIWKALVQWASRATKSMQSNPSVRLSFNRLPSWKRNTPAPAMV